MKSKINWQGEDDDLTAYVGKFCLRVEQMDKNYWWCCVYYKDETIKHSSATTLEEAQLKAIKIMNKYKRENGIKN